LRLEELVVLLTIRYCGRAGRYQLSELLGLGEGKIRRILNKLKSEDLIEVKRGGSKLTEKGEKAIEEALAKMRVKKAIFFRGLEDDLKDKLLVCFQLKSVELGNIIELRDIAVREGAEGALIGVVKNREIFLPPDLGFLSKYFPKMWKYLKKSLIFEPSDVVVLSFSKDYGKALAGGIAIVRRLSARNL